MRRAVKGKGLLVTDYPFSSGEKTVRTVLLVMGGGKNAPSAPCTLLHDLPDQHENSLYAISHRRGERALELQCMDVKAVK